MQTTELTTIFAEVNNFLQSTNAPRVEYADDEYVKNILNMKKYDTNTSVDPLDNFFDDLENDQITNDLKHHISRANTNYIDYGEYTREENLQLGAGMIGHIMHSTDPHNKYFRTNYENLASHIAPEFKENISPSHYGTYGGTLTDLKHNPGIMNTIHHHFKAHSNMYNELHHRNHQRKHQIVNELHFSKHAHEILHHYKNNVFKQHHENVNRMTSPCYAHDRAIKSTWNKDNHYKVMQEARENGDYKLRDELVEHFTKLF